MSARHFTPCLAEVLPIALDELVDRRIKSHPIAATLTLEGPDLTGHANFDFRETGNEVWGIRLTSPNGEGLTLSQGGAALQIGDGPVEREPEQEYRGLYNRFAQLLSEGTREVDLQPLQLVADAFLCGTRHAVPAFHDPASVSK